MSFKVVGLNCGILRTQTRHVPSSLFCASCPYPINSTENQTIDALLIAVVVFNMIMPMILSGLHSELPKSLTLCKNCVNKSVFNSAGVWDLRFMAMSFVHFF